MVRIKKIFQAANVMIVALIVAAISALVSQFLLSHSKEREYIAKSNEQRAIQFASQTAERINAMVLRIDSILLVAREESAGKAGRAVTHQQTVINILIKSLQATKPQILFFNAEGTPLHHSPAPGRPETALHKKIIDQHRTGKDELLVSAPIAGAEGGNHFLQFSRPFLNNGRFDGAVVMLMSTAGLAKALNQHRMAETDIISLLDMEGRILADNGGNDTLIGKPVFGAGKHPGSAGTFRTASAFDPKERIFSRQAIAAAPLVVAVAISEKNALDRLDQQVRASYPFLALTALAIIGLGASSMMLLGRTLSSQRRVNARDSQLKAILDNVPACVARISPWGELLTVNRAGLSMFEAGSAEQVQTLPFTRFLPADQRERFIAMLQRVVAGATEEIELEIKGMRGTRRTLEINAAPLMFDDSTQTEMILVAQDITTRKKAELELRNREAQLSGLIESAMDAIISINEAHEIILFNPAAEKIFGYQAGEALGLPLGRLLPDKHRPAHDMAIRQFGQGGVTTRKMSNLRDLTGLRANGEEFTAEGTISKLRHGDRMIYTVILRDITEKRRTEKLKQELEEQLRQSQKMEALGTLAGGIAHDFNNILTVIHGNAELALEPGTDAIQKSGRISGVIKAASRAKDLVNQILTFSRQSPTEKQVLDMADIVRDTLELMENSFPAEITLMAKLGADPAPVLADRSQMQQVVMNLLTNARQAIGDQSGRVSITMRRLETAITAEPGDHGDNTAEGSGQSIELAVTDTGCGIDSENLKQIFNPFFSTKTKEGGTGLGLSVVDGIIRNHGGRITVNSKPGMGSTFTVLLPAATGKELMPPTAPVVPAAHPIRTGQHILYLDDDESLVEVIKHMLERLGFKVDGHHSAQQALASLRADPKKIDLFVADMNMPGKSGIEVLTEALTLRPDLQVVLASGVVTEELKAEALAHGIRSVIHKPSSVRELIMGLQLILDESAVSSGNSADGKN